MNTEELFGKLQTETKEPSVYALYMITHSAEQLYLGIHYSLEEAYLAGKKKMLAIMPDGLKDEPISFDLWSVIPAREVLKEFFDAKPVRFISDEERKNILQAFKKGLFSIEKSPSERFNDTVHEEKNKMIKELIESKDEEKIKKNSKISPNEKKLIKDKIKKNKK
jgi:hypothetical protein